MLDFWSGQKRIYAKLTPLTPKIKAHYRVTKSALAEKRVPFLCLGDLKKERFAGGLCARQSVSEFYCVMAY
jgi:Rad3-related DNA helicase